MGARKREMADRLKAEQKVTGVEKLNSEQSSPRKMRLVENVIRGKEVFQAMNILKFTRRHAAIP
ncbi:MAG: 50S ribosomal protein L22, partial [Flavobacteriales bacterium]